MVHMYLQLVVVFSPNIALSKDVLSVERIELLIARQCFAAVVSLLWTEPSINIRSGLRHCLADDLQELFA